MYTIYTTNVHNMITLCYGVKRYVRVRNRRASTILKILEIDGDIFDEFDNSNNHSIVVVKYHSKEVLKPLPSAA